MAKCLRLNGWNPCSNWLKHPQALSLHSICLSLCVYACVYSAPPTCSNLKRPETEEAMQRIRNWYSKIPDTGSLDQSRGRQGWLPGEPCWGNPGTILVKSMPKGKRILKMSFLWSPTPSEKKEKKIESRVKTGRVCVYKGLHFRNQCLQSSLLAVTSI